MSTELKGIDRVMREVESLKKVGFDVAYCSSGIIVSKASLKEYKDHSTFAFYQHCTTVEEFLVFAQTILEIVMVDCKSTKGQKLKALQEMAALKLSRYEEE